MGNIKGSENGVVAALQPKPKPAPVVIPLPWDGKHKDAKAWTEHLREELLRSKLLDLKASGTAFYPGYEKLTQDLRLIFWMNLISIMAKYESSWKPETTFQEPGGDAGPGTLSIGLLQVSVEDDKNYRMNLGLTKEKLKDPLVNLSVAVRIMESLVSQNGQISGKGDDGKWKGISRYWSVMRYLKNDQPRESYEAIKKHLHGLKLVAEQAPAPKPVESPSEMPWLELAKKYDGMDFAERKDPAENPNIVEAFKYTSYKSTSDETPWCAAWVCMVLAKSGYKHTNSAAAASYDTYGTKCELKPGAIVTKYRNGGSGRHVTICLKVNSDRKTFQGLGGNQGNDVRVSTYNIADIAAIRWPVKA